MEPVETWQKERTPRTEYIGYYHLPNATLSHLLSGDSTQLEAVKEMARARAVRQFKNRATGCEAVCVAIEVKSKVEGNSLVVSAAVNYAKDSSSISSTTSKKEKRKGVRWSTSYASYTEIDSGTMTVGRKRRSMSMLAQFPTATGDDPSTEYCSIPVSKLLLCTSSGTLFTFAEVQVLPSQEETPGRSLATAHVFSCVSRHEAQAMEDVIQAALDVAPARMPLGRGKKMSLRVAMSSRNGDPMSAAETTRLAARRSAQVDTRERSSTGSCERLDPVALPDETPQRQEARKRRTAPQQRRQLQQSGAVPDTIGVTGAPPQSTQQPGAADDSEEEADYIPVGVWSPPASRQPVEVNTTSNVVVKKRAVSHTSTGTLETTERLV